MNDPGTTQPQDAFAELAGITLADHSLDSVMTTIADLAQRTLPGAAEVSVTFLERDTPRTVAFTGEVAVSLDERQYERGYGPCLDCIVGGEPLVIPRMRDEQRWPRFAEAAVQQGIHSSMSIPVPLQREVMAALNVYGRDEGAFDQPAVELARTFAAYAGVALANMHLYEAQGQVAEQLQQAMESRASIEQAKGILMGQQRCTAAEAFDLLTLASQRENRKLREIASDVVRRAIDPEWTGGG